MTEPLGPRSAPPGGGLRAALSDAENFDPVAVVGGWRGMLDSGIPGVLFVAVFGVVRDLSTAVWVAVGAAALLTVLRLLARETVQHALSGLVGIAICAFVATRTGRAQDFYLPGLLINVGYALGYVASILVRWPLLGFVVGPLGGWGLTGWRSEPALVRAFARASWVWVAMFLLRVAVQLPLYLAGESAVGALGIARVAMGLPLFAVSCWFTWLLLRHLPRPARAGSPAGDAADDVDGPEAR